MTTARDEEFLYGKRFLSPFQIEKFTYMFNTFFDQDSNGFLEQFDIDALVEKIRVYCGIDKGSKQYNHILDVHKAFYECLKDQVAQEKVADAAYEGFDSWDKALSPSKVDVSSITLNQWLNMWGRLCHGAAGVSGFPIWVQLLLSIFFETIDRDSDGVLSKDEIRNFYSKFIGVDPKNLEKILNEGHRVMTGDGTYTLNRMNYYFCFANFLLGRTIHGPGKYIFGVFDNSELDEPFKVKYNDDDE